MPQSGDYNSEQINHGDGSVKATLDALVAEVANKLGIPLNPSDGDVLTYKDGAWIAKRPSGGSGGTVSMEWDDIIGKPSTYTPSAHNHSKSEITDFPTTMAPSAHNHTKSEITDFPETMPPSAHTHTADEVEGIPTVNDSTITIKKNGVTVDSFSTNAAQGKEINITFSKSDAGLGNVNNTSDLNKPISTATQTALNAKLDASKIVVTNVAPTVGSTSSYASGTIIAVYEG